MIEAAIEILAKYRHIAHRLELVNHRRTPNITCKAVKPTQDYEGDGGKLSPDIYIYISHSKVLYHIAGRHMA